MTETLEAPTKLELRERMGLANERDRLATLQVTIKNKRGTPISNVHALLTALVITPDSHSILYLECCATSSAVAHCIMAAIGEQSNTVQEWSFCPTKDRGFVIHPKDGMRVADCKLAVKGHPGLHHFALLDQSGDFILANSDEVLWQKLRKKMSCPTKESWGAELLPRVKEEGCLLECEAMGMPENMKVYVLQLDADAVFDRLVGQIVRERGL